jgi:hypothetical protein
MFASFFLTNLKVFYAMLFLGGAVIPGKGVVLILYACEFMTPKQQIIFNSMALAIDSFTLVLITFYYWFIDNHYVGITSVGVVMGLILVFGLIVSLPESFLWMVKVGRKTEAATEMHRLNVVSSPEKAQEVFERYPSPDEATVKVDVSQYFRDSKIVTNLVVMTISWSVTSYCYYMLGFYIKYMPGGIYPNYLALGLSEVFGAFVGGYFTLRFGLKISFIVLFLISLIGGVLIIIVGEENETWMPVFLILAKLGISAIFCCVYAGTVQVFPTLFGGTAYGVCNFVARLLTICAPIVAEKSPPTPMITFVALCMLGMCSAAFLRVQHEKAD